MVRIIYIEDNGNEHEVEARSGDTVMSAAFRNMIPGIDAECGGSCSCATCHVFIEPEWMDKVGPAGPYEDPMLDMNPERNERSRLSCQIDVNESLDGLTVRIPAQQY